MRIHLLLDTALHQLLMHMVVHAGEDDRDTLFVRTLNEHTQVMHGRRIDERHLTHTNDTDRVLLAAYMQHDLVEAVRDTEEIRAIDLIHLHALRDGQVLEVQMTLAVFVRIDLMMQRADMCLLVRPHQEQHHC